MMQDPNSRYQVVERPWQPTQKPATLGETWDASRVLAEVDNTNADDVRIERAYDAPLAAVNAQRRKEGLPPIANPTFGIRFIDPRGVSPGVSAYGQANNARVGQDEAQRLFYAEVGRIRRSQPDFLKEIGDDPTKYMSGVVEREKGRRGQAREVLERSDGVAGALTGFAGGVSKAMEDPVNLATLPIGGGGRTIVGIMAREAALNGAIELLSQPQAARNRAVVGEELSAGEIALNVGGAAVGGAVISGGFAAAGMAIGPAWDGAMRRVFDALPENLQQKWMGAATLPDDAIADIAEATLGADRFTPDMRAAVQVLRRSGEMEATSPFARGNGERHADMVGATIQSIIDGTPPIRAAGTARARLAGETALSTAGVAPSMGRMVTPDLDGFMRAVRVAESGGSDVAAATKSSAFGRYQFTRGTWLTMYLKRYGRGGLSDAAILAKRADGNMQDALMRDLTMANANALARAGHPATGANLYLTHFLGPGDAVKVLNAAPGTPLRGLVRNDAIAANGFLSKMTVADLHGFTQRKVGSKVDGAPASPGSPVRTPEDEVRFDDLDAADVRLEAEARGLDADTPAARTADVLPDVPVGRKAEAFVPVTPEERAAWTDAVAAMRATEGGTIRNALHHPEIGDIDVRWGTPGDAEKDWRGGHGLAHILAKHPEMDAVLPDLPDIIAAMTVKQRRPERVVLESPNHEASVALTWHGDDERWLVTAYEKKTPDGPTSVREPMDGGSGSSRPEALPDIGGMARADNVGGDMPVALFDDYDDVVRVLVGDPGAAAARDIDDPVWDAIDAEEVERAMAGADPEPSAALRGYDDPVGADAQAAADSMLHDLRTAIETDPAMTLRIDEEDRSAAEVLAELDADRAAIDAVKGCL